MKAIYFAVISDLSYDQRMKRICRSLAHNGYDIVLVGKKTNKSVALSTEPYRQIRLQSLFTSGKLHYIEFNLKLFLFLLFRKMDAICAIDLDTIVPCYWISKLKSIPRVYDAHELFCEMQEIVRRPTIYKFWKAVERRMVPQFKMGYTVNQPIADEFRKMYGSGYEVIRNITELNPKWYADTTKANYILYQGAVNEGRSFETLIPAMQYINVPLWICGDGNFMQQAKMLVAKHQLEDKVIFKGNVLPEQLRAITAAARIGITLFEKKGLSNYYSLANRFFDYLHAGIPQLCVDYPVYRQITQEFEVAYLIDDLSPENIARCINLMLADGELYNRLQQNCLKARQVYNWQQEEQKLVSFYKALLP